jgi:hypothetical protein
MLKIDLIPTWMKLAALGAVLALAFAGGVWVRDAFCDAAKARAALAAERAAHAATKSELAAAQQAAAFANRALGMIEESARTREEAVREKQTSPPPACRQLTAPDLEWLRRVAPD